MATNDLSNPKVLINHVQSMINEGRGEVFVKKNVKCFRTPEGLEIVLPDDFETKPIPENLEELDLEDLKEVAKEHNLKGWALMGKETLIDRLTSLITA